MKPHLRLHVTPDGAYWVELKLTWTPSFGGQRGTAREVLVTIRRYLPDALPRSSWLTTHNRRTK